VSFKELCKRNNSSQKFIAHCFEAKKLNIKSIEFQNTESLFLIGPEGDFTLEEVNWAKENDFKEISLGDNRLRTETAGLLVCMAAQLLS
jgi:16S rRNA (uracil1498-N3)-methyltransferase